MMNAPTPKESNPINRISRRSQYAIILLIFLVLGATIVFFAHRTFTTTANDAVSAMNPEEREVLYQVLSITREMSQSDVYQLLGEPTSDLVVIAQWDNFAGSMLSRGRVYYINGKPDRFRWIKLGYFLYEVKY